MANRLSAGGTRWSRQARLARNRVFESLAEFLRNFGLLFMAAPLVEPLTSIAPFSFGWRSAASIGFGFVLLGVSLILDVMRKD